MASLPDYIGPAAFGIKLPVIQPGDDIENIVYYHLKKCDKDNLLENNSIVCITESVVARSQNNYIKLDDVAKDISIKLKLKEDSNIGVLFPIASRNRFSAILSGIAKSVPNGIVYVQFPVGKDEVGNRLANHPITKMNYFELYEEIIKQEGAIPFVIESNKYDELYWADLNGMLVSSIHTRSEDLQKVKKHFKNSITLQDICNEPVVGRDGWSEWGVLGSNLSEGKLKLAPRDSTILALNLQKRIKQNLGKHVEVMIYGDGAYKDPSTGIYELADPVVAFGYTPDLENQREGVKYKFLADRGLAQGLNKQQIEEMILKESQEMHEANSIKKEGTTPRPLKDIVGSLADLLSGSADAGTPVVIAKGILKK